MSREKAGIITGFYFVLATFTIIGNPFPEIKTVTIPIFGILLTLPWSLLIGKITSSITIGLELCAVLNGLIIFIYLFKLRMRKKPL